MRIVLKKGKQRQLIESCKGNFTWEELGKKLGCSPLYLKLDLRYERRYLSDKLYNKLNKMSNKDFNVFIIKKLDDNWGKSKGGFNSLGNTKEIIEPLESEDLAELIGIALGDGHLEKFTRGKKTHYKLIVAGDSRKDLKYLMKISDLFKKLFGEKGIISYSKTRNVAYSQINGKRIVEFLEKKGIKSGNKKLNNQSIPKWIINNDKYLGACLRGLIDTDGCIYYISKNNKNLRISFTSYIPNLMRDTRDAFIKLGFHPSKIIVNKNICLSRKEDIKKYLKEIGFSNSKHLKRLHNLTKNAPVV